MNAHGVSRASLRPLRNAHFVRTVVQAWRRLTREPKGKTLVACSGGADSLALLLALAASEPDAITVAHIRHDMREPSETEADARIVEGLCDALGVPFRLGQVTGATTEGRARNLRYDALAAIAAERSCPFLATAHHADDQLETFLMAAIRGAGPAGLRGVAERRTLDASVTLVRPMLGVTHADAEGFCKEAGVAWREDPTNTDTARTRAAIRANVVPALCAIRSDAAQRVSQAVHLQRDAHALVRHHAGSLANNDHAWTRSSLAGQPGIVVGQLLRGSAVALGLTKQDRLSQRLVRDAVEAIRDTSTEPRVFEWAQGVRVRVTAHEVSMSRIDAPT